MPSLPTPSKPNLCSQSSPPLTPFTPQPLLPRRSTRRSLNPLATPQKLNSTHTPQPAGEDNAINGSVNNRGSETLNRRNGKAPVQLSFADVSPDHGETGKAVDKCESEVVNRRNGKGSVIQLETKKKKRKREDEGETVRTVDNGESETLKLRNGKASVQSSIQSETKERKKKREDESEIEIMIDKRGSEPSMRRNGKASVEIPFMTVTPVQSEKKKKKKKKGEDEGEAKRTVTRAMALRKGKLKLEKRREKNNTKMPKRRVYYKKVVYDGGEFEVGDDVYVKRREDGSSDEEVDPEVEECRICFGSGSEVMIECDGCLGGFHLKCLKPPLKEVPEGD